MFVSRDSHLRNQKGNERNKRSLWSEQPTKQTEKIKLSTKTNLFTPSFFSVCLLSLLVCHAWILFCVSFVILLFVHFSLHSFLETVWCVIIFLLQETKKNGKEGLPCFVNIHRWFPFLPLVFLSNQHFPLLISTSFSFSLSLSSFSLIHVHISFPASLSLSRKRMRNRHIAWYVFVLNFQLCLCLHPILLLILYLLCFRCVLIWSHCLFLLSSRSKW